MKRCILCFVFCIFMFSCKKNNEKIQLCMDNVYFEDVIYVYDGKIHSLEVFGYIPKDVEVVYKNNFHKDIGTYYVVASFIVDESKYEKIPNMFAYLKIIDNKYKITYKIEKDVLIPNKEQEVIYGEKFILPIPIKEGYFFEGWYCGDIKINDGYWFFTRDKEVEARWKK